MSNEVEIVITGKDLSGPAFASAEKHVLTLRAMVSGLRQDLKNLEMPTLDSGAMERGLISLKSKMQALHIADIADVNINPGLIMTQMNLLKRLISQAGINDILDINVSSASLTKAMARLSNLSADVPVNFDVSGLDALKSALASKSGGLTVPVKYEVQGGPNLPAMGDTIPVHFKPDLAALNAELRVLSRTEETIPVKFDVGAMPDLPKFGTSESVHSGAMGIDPATLASWAALRGETYKLQAGLGDLRPLLVATGILMGRAGYYATGFARKIGSDLNPYLVGAGVVMDRVLIRLGAFGAGLGVLGRAVAGVIGGGGGGGGGLVGLRGGVGGFGATLAYTLPILGLTIRSVAAWHVVLDGVIEAIIAVGMAAVTAAPGIAVLVNIGKDLDTHFAAVHTVTETLGQSIPPLTGKFDDLARAMVPQAIEIFGGAMNIIASRTGLFANAATRVITLFDDWTAKIVLWANAQSQVGKFIGAGIGYLSQFGAIIGNVGSAIGNLLTKDPGIAHYLLNIVNGAAQVLKAFSNLPGPLVYTTLALHGLYVWTSVLAPAIGLLAGKIVTFAGDLLLLAANPLTWVVIAAAGLAYLATQAGRADTATRDFIGSIDKNISSMSATDAILGIAGAIGQLDTKIADAASSHGLDQIKAHMYDLGNLGSTTVANVTQELADFRSAFADLSGVFSQSGWNNAVHAFGKAFRDVFNGTAGASIIARQNIAAFDAEINKLIDQQGTLFRVAGALTTQGYSLAQSFALEDLAGVKAADSFALAKQKVDDLITGYKDMSVTGGILENSVNAITFASLQQQSGISNLNQGWTTFIKTVTDGQVQFSTFQKDVYGISKALTGVAPAASKGAASMGGLNDASLDVSKQFALNVNNANSLINALTLQASASGLGARGTDLLTAATKDAVAEMIPLAGHSKVAQSSLIALAQQGGAPANISFRDLSKWVSTASGSMGKASKSGGPASQLNSIMGTLSQSSSNLTTDVQNLSLALGTNLTQAEAGAIQLARGGTKPFDDFATAVANTGASSDLTKKKAIILGDEFLKLANNNVPQAKAEFESFAVSGLGLLKSQADALWIDITKNGIPTLNNSGKAAFSAKGSFVNWAQNGLDLTKTSAQGLWTEITGKLGPGMDGLGNLASGSAKKKFIDWAENGLHLSQRKATDLYNELVTLQRRIDSMHGKNVGVNFIGSGTGNISFQETGGSADFPIVKGALKFAAAGGFISGGVPGKDSVLGMLMPGEVVVPVPMVKAGAVDHLRGQLPGFAGGGVAGSTGSSRFSGLTGSSGVLSAGQPFMEHAEESFGRAVENAFAKRVIAKFKRDMAAQVSGSSSDIVGYAESLLGKIPYVWGGQSISGADCSGFTSLVYHHAGIGTIPRTSEGQGAWVNRGKPTAGGLAFYHSPAGGPDPGHVAIVAGNGQVISQGGGMGPKMESLNFLPLLWTGTPPGGFGTLASIGSAGNISKNPSIAAEQRYAASLFPSHGWSQALMPALISLWNIESGWSANAVNPSSGAYGIPQALPSVWGHPYALGDAGPQIVWGENYIQSRWNNPAAALGNEFLHHWYAGGGMVPAFSTGGSIASQGAGYLKAWQTRHGGGFGAAWGPVVVNEQIAEMQARSGHDSTLAKAGGLSSSQRRHWSLLAADDKRRLSTLNRELTTERSWRSDLGASDNKLSSWIHAAGSNPSLSRNVRGWKSQLAHQKSTIGNISNMLGWSNAHLAAFPPQPPVTHTYGGDVANTTGAFLQSVLNPFTGVSMDRGGWLKPGWNPPMYNGTGQPERVGGTGCTEIRLVIDDAGSSAFEQFLHMSIRKHVKIKGGGNVQRAYGLAGSA